MNPTPLPHEAATARLFNALRWIVLVSILAMLIVLGGCASGVVMTEEERIACRNEGCAPFTNTEIRALIGKVFNDAFRLGWIDATKRAGTGI